MLYYIQAERTPTFHESHVEAIASIYSPIVALLDGRVSEGYPDFYAHKEQRSHKALHYIVCSLFLLGGALGDLVSSL